MLDAIVQLIRNGLCCVKDLNLGENNEYLSFLWDPSVTHRYLESYIDFREPLHKTTPLEVLISICQFYAFVSVTSNGVQLFWKSWGKQLYIEKLMVEENNSKPKDVTDRIIQDSLIKEQKYAIRSMMIGFLVFWIGLSFLWLTANSWHITETNWLGGLPGLMMALSINELCLLPLVYLMYRDGSEQIQKSKRMERMAQELLENKKNKEFGNKIGLSSFEMMTDWLPFWDAGISPLSIPSSTSRSSHMKDERQKVTDLLQSLFRIQDEKQEKLRHERIEQIAEELQAHSRRVRWEGYREYLYFVLNFIAFYGYLLGIIVYQYSAIKQEDHPWIVPYLVFHMPHHLADWRGNFAGDLMWTIEPVFILASPSLFQYFLKPKADEKAKLKKE